MKRAEYKLPFGVNPALEPVETGRTPDTTTKDGTVIKGKPIYTYRVVKTDEAETLDEFITTQVEQDKPQEHTLSLAQAQLDIIKQRKIREWAAGEECDQILQGTAEGTEDMSEDERIEHALQRAQEIGDEYKYGSRGPSTGGVNAQAKAALKKQKALDEAAASNPEVAAKLAELQATLAAMGINV